MSSRYGLPIVWMYPSGDLLCDIAVRIMTYFCQPLSAGAEILNIVVCSQEINPQEKLTIRRPYIMDGQVKLSAVILSAPVPDTLGSRYHRNQTIPQKRELSTRYQCARNNRAIFDGHHWSRPGEIHHFIRGK